MRYALVYAAILGIAVTLFLWSTNRYIDAQLRNDLEREMSFLAGKFDAGGKDQIIKTLATNGSDAAENSRVFLFVSARGENIAGNLIGWPDDADIPFDNEVHNVWIDEQFIPQTLYDDDAFWPVIAREFSDGSRLLLGRNTEQDEELQEITEFLITVMSVAVLLALILGISVGRTILGRMDVISRTAGQIMSGDLAQRVPVSTKNDEFDALATQLNSMLDRIQQLIKGIREVTDNIAHDLRSPLTRLRNRLEVTRLEPRTEPEYRDAIDKGIEDADSLIKTFNALLGIAQTEAGNHRTEWKRVRLDTLASDLADLYRPVAEERGQKFVFAAGPEVELTGSRDLLAQAIGNLLENAIKYTPDKGTVQLVISATAESIEVSVSDTGPGIPESEREHVLERFVRLENSRHTAGNGLGLSLVSAVAKLHRAELQFSDNAPGLRVTLRFPRNGAD